MEVGLLLIFWYGVLHAFGPDHLTAIADFSIGKRPRQTFLITLIFALGQGLTLYLFAKLLAQFPILAQYSNVGNLVCPASYDVGSHLNVVLVSVPEGDDKIEKYPVMFHKADLVIISKTDLLPYFDFDMQAAKAMAGRLKSNADILELSTKDADSVGRLVDWIEFKRKMRA